MERTDWCRRPRVSSVFGRFGGFTLLLFLALLLLFTGPAFLLELLNLSPFLGLGPRSHFLGW